MSQQQFQHEVMDELMQEEYNTNFGTIGDSSVNLHSRRDSSTNGEIWQVGQIPMQEGKAKRN